MNSHPIQPHALLKIHEIEGHRNLPTLHSFILKTLFDFIFCCQDAVQMFAVHPIKWCAHLEDNKPLPHELDATAPCMDCGNLEENWVCLTCYKVAYALDTMYLAHCMYQIKIGRAHV